LRHKIYPFPKAAKYETDDFTTFLLSMVKIIIYRIGSFPIFSVLEQLTIDLPHSCYLWLRLNIFNPYSIARYAYMV